jgi:hypothetical protein
MRLPTARPSATVSPPVVFGDQVPEVSDFILSHIQKIENHEM